MVKWKEQIDALNRKHDALNQLPYLREKKDLFGGYDFPLFVYSHEAGVVPYLGRKVDDIAVNEDWPE